MSWFVGYELTIFDFSGFITLRTMKHYYVIYLLFTESVCSFIYRSRVPHSWNDWLTYVGRAKGYNI